MCCAPRELLTNSKRRSKFTLASATPISYPSTQRSKTQHEVSAILNMNRGVGSFTEGSMMHVVFLVMRYAGGGDLYKKLQSTAGHRYAQLWACSVHLLSRLMAILCM